MLDEEKILARHKPGCICKGIKLIRLLTVIEQGADSFEQVARKTGIGDGDCGGKRCRARVEMLLAARNPEKN